MNIPYGPVLVVEDMPNVRDLLKYTLHFQGYPVITAANGVEALEMIAVEHPALVIADILMPRMDGFALAQKLRSDPHTTHIPIIFVSATYITPEDKDFAMRMGAVRFIEKPIDTEEFLLTVAEVLTQDNSDLPQPLDNQVFYTGYRERLESKLQYKISQIARTERLLTSLPEQQKAAFTALLEQSVFDRDQIIEELNDLKKAQQ